MKIVFAHTDFRLYWPARLAAARRYLGDHGAELQVVEIAGQGSPYAFAGRTASNDWWRCLFPEERMEALAPKQAFAAVCAALDELNPDVVFAGAIAFPSGAAALRWARKKKRRVVIFDDARREDVPRNALINAVKQRLYGQADAFLLPAESHAADFEFWGVPRERMFYGVNVVDNAFFSERADAARGEVAQWRQELDLPERFVLGVGRQVEKKNWLKLIEACEGTELVLVGNGSDRGRLERLAGRNVRFRDFVLPEMLAVYYGLASALVLPSMRGETWGLVVNEAMASGLPVLVSRQCGCCSTLVEEDGNGATFNASDVVEIAAVLRNFRSKPDSELARMGQRSRQIIAHWGLNRFCDGVWAAVEHTRELPAKRVRWEDRVLLELWKGRYRPT